MDAFDLFKKLTRGAKFSRPNKVSLQLSQSVVKEEIEENNGIGPAKNTENEKTNSHTITLLSSLGKDEEIVKNKRKLKHEDDSTIERKKRLLEEERVNHYRNLLNITVVGRNIPEPYKSFDEFKVDQDIVENLRKCGYEEPTPIQKQAVPLMIEGRQILACAPTGSGKTAAFLVPIIQALGGPRRQGFRALILCPTRELAKQTQRECVRLSEGRGFHIHIISSIKKALIQYGPKSSQKYDILITTPNRLCYLLKQNPPSISLTNIQWVVIDEADKLFETGNRGFREQLADVLRACSSENRKIAMFSATHTPVVAKWCVHNMKGLVRVTVGHRNSATDLVDQELLFVGNEQGKLLAFRDIVRKGISPPVLVFVQSKERAQQLFNELLYDGINVDAIHADRTQLQRDNSVRSFREGRIWVLICTELMARGVDFKGVNLVINYDFPSSAISYIHRIGRAGRAGRRGKAITFFTTEDTVNLRSIAHILKESGCTVPAYMLKMKKPSKKEKKRREKSAPKRNEIITKPIYDRLKGGKKNKFKELHKIVKEEGIKENRAKKRAKNSTNKTHTKPTKKMGKQKKITQKIDKNAVI